MHQRGKPVDAEGEPPLADLDARRIRAALADLIDELDYRRITVEMVVRRAGVPADAFHRRFADLDACLLDLWRQARDAFLRQTLPAFASAESWRDRLRATAWAICRFMQEDHQRARTIMFQLEVGGDAVRAERDMLIHQFVLLVDLARQETPDPEALSPDFAAGVASAVWDRLDELVRAGDFDQMPAAVPEMMFISVLPYFGEDAAKAELRRGRDDIDRYVPPD